MPSFLVTGGVGFIGSNIVEELVRLGHSVRMPDNFATGKRENLTPFMDKIDLIEGDSRDEETCRRAVDGTDYVLHQETFADLQQRSRGREMVIQSQNQASCAKLSNGTQILKLNWGEVCPQAGKWSDRPFYVSYVQMVQYGK